MRFIRDYEQWPPDLDESRRSTEFVGEFVLAFLTGLVFVGGWLVVLWVWG